MDDNHKELFHYRLYRAELELQAAKSMLAENNYFKALSSSYYAMFHAARAICAIDDFDSKKHSGIISFFDKHYIATGKMDKKYSRYLHAAFKIRQDSDYEDFYVATREDAEQQVEHAVEFIADVKEFMGLNEEDSNQ